MLLGSEGVSASMRSVGGGRRYPWTPFAEPNNIKARGVVVVVPEPRARPFNWSRVPMNRTVGTNLEDGRAGQASPALRESELQGRFVQAFSLGCFV